MTKKIPINESFLALLEQLLPQEQIEEFVIACRKPLKKSISVTTAKLSPSQLINTAEERGWTLSDPKFRSDPTTFYIDRENVDLALGNTFLYQCWFFYIQEVAASLSAIQIETKPGDIILDMAAAPGGKTSQLANRLLTQSNTSGTPGLVVANDVNGKRLGTLAHNVNKCWCYNTLLTRFNGWSFGSNLPDFFDHVLLDAPCSGEWTWYKSDVAMKYRKQAEINKICGTQLQLLISAIKTVKIWGTVVYSTCTLNPFENEELVAKVLTFFNGSVELESIELENISPGIARTGEEHIFTQTDKVARCRPHLQHTGGFFITKLRKIGDTKRKEPLKDHKLLPKNQFKIDQSKWLQKKVTKRLADYFGIDIDPRIHYFMATKEKLYLCSPDIKHVLPHLHSEKIGVPIAKIDRAVYRPTHHLGNILWHTAKKQTLEVSDEHMQAYVLWNNIPLSELDTSSLHDEKKYVILTRKERWMSIGKLVNDEVKNKFIR